MDHKMPVEANSPTAEVILVQLNQISLHQIFLALILQMKIFFLKR